MNRREFLQVLAAARGRRACRSTRARRRDGADGERFYDVSRRSAT